MSTMTSNLYPPLVEDILPSINYKQDSFKIYFTFPLYTSSTDIDYIQVSITNQQTNLSAFSADYPVGIKVTSKWFVEDLDSEYNYYIEVNKSELLNGGLQLNNFYKVQLRFGNLLYAGEEIPENPKYDWINSHKNKCSEWSKVCLIKGINPPTIYINEFPNQTDLYYEATTTFTDTLAQISGNVVFENGEKEYLKSYHIQIRDELDNSIFFDSGEVFTNIYNPNEFYYEISSENFDLARNYTLIFTYTTSNGYSQSLEKNFVVIENSGESIEVSELIITPDDANGRMKIETVPTQESFIGNLTIRRTSSKSNFSKWEDVYTTTITENAPLKLIWYDYTIESGVFYHYGIQKRNSLGKRGIIVKTAEPKMCLFQDMFLTRADRQLNIKLNPSLNEFKYNVTESQAITIGSKYPFVRRNGANYFRTFPIGGLISSFVDTTDWYDHHFIKKDHEHNSNEKDQFDPKTSFDSEANEIGLFTTKNQIYKNETIKNLYNDYNLKNNINDYNDYIYERNFREKVYDFLYANNVKLFRSTTEGNILIKLMNIDFQPVETLGRMLYSFTATAVEIDQANISNYDKYGIQLLGNYSQEVKSLTHRSGELTETFPANKNIIDIIQQRYQTISPDGFITEIQDMNYLKLEIDSDPYVIIKNSSGKWVKAPIDASQEDLEKAYLGYIVSINGNDIIIPPAMERRNDFPDDETSSARIIHLGFFELKGDNVSIKNIQFPYPITAARSYETNVADIEDTSKLVESYYQYQNVGQLYQTFFPPTISFSLEQGLQKNSLIKNIYFKYFFNYPDYYEKLTWIDEVDIQGPTNTVVYVKGPRDNHFNRILLINGFYQIKDDQIMKRDNSINDYSLINISFYGRHFVKRTSFTPKHFTIDQTLRDEQPTENIDPNKIYYIKEDAPTFSRKDFSNNILYIDPQHITQDHQDLIIDVGQMYKKCVYINNEWYLCKDISLTTGEPKYFKEYLRLDDAEYIEIIDFFSNLEEIEDPILNGMYTLNNGERWLYYENNWFLLNENNDILCPIDGIVNYTYSIEKGVYNKQ